MRCPLDEIGRNSERPCTIPRMMAWSVGKGSEMVRALLASCRNRGRLLRWHQREVSTAFACASARRSATSRSTSSVTPSESVRPVPPPDRLSVRSTRAPAATTTVVGSPSAVSAVRESKLASTSIAAPGRGRTAPLTVTRIARMPKGTMPSSPLRCLGARFPADTKLPRSTGTVTTRRIATWVLRRRPAAAGTGGSGEPRGRHVRRCRRPRDRGWRRSRRARHRGRRPGGGVRRDRRPRSRRLPRRRSPRRLGAQARGETGQSGGTLGILPEGGPGRVASGSGEGKGEARGVLLERVGATSNSSALRLRGRRPTTSSPTTCSRYPDEDEAEESGLLRLLGLLGRRRRIARVGRTSGRDRLAALRLSVRWKPEPLNTMPTGWRTLASLPPHPGCFFSGSSENDCHSSISSPHLAHS